MANSTYIAFFSQGADIKTAALSLSDKLNIRGRTTSKILSKSVSGQLKEIKKIYKSLIKNTQDSTQFLKWEEWLSDNYYIIEREIKFALNALLKTKSLPAVRIAGKGAIPAAFCYAGAFCEITDNKITSSDLVSFLNFAQTKRAFESYELELFGLMLKMALCEQIYLICTDDDRKKNQDKKGRLLGNAVISLKFLTGYDFEDCFDKVSMADQIFSKDPVGIYQNMTDESKHLYREKLALFARKKGITEENAANELLKKALQGKTEAKRHIGYKLFIKSNDKNTKIYISCQAFIPIIFSLIIGHFSGSILYSLLLYLPVWEVFKHIFDYIISKYTRASYLPQLELNEIPKEGAVSVIISVLLTSKEDVFKLKAKLEKIYFANKGGSICFGILADLKDSKTEVSENDIEIKEALNDIISQLNTEYDNTFFALLRKRKFNKQQGKYMGWERKRGAIIELVRLIKDGKSHFEIAVGSIDRLKTSKYLITLDADTSLPLNGARELVGTMLHPLNKPTIDAKKRLVTRGYGLITPRIGIDIDSANATFFSKITAGFGGTETYNNPAFDIYQQVFDEGIFTGKGIIDVNAFYITAANTFPENRILSHDLLEGCFIRTGYMSELVFTDTFPSGMLSYFDRQHRWIRGDFQALSYALPYIFNDKNKKIKNPLNMGSRFKLIDNVRRALLPVFAFLLLLSGAFLPLKAAAIFISVSLLTVFISTIISSLDLFFHNGLKVLGIRYTTRTYPAAVSAVLKGIISFVFLPYNAVISLDAAIRAAWRLLATKKKLLDWVTAAQTDARQKDTFPEYFFKMSHSIAAGVILFLSPYLLIKIFAVMFILSPFVAHKISIKKEGLNYNLDPKKKEIAINYAKDMWKFFAEFLNKENNYLPPDNYQESPLGIQAHRTSPTNIGLSLLCCLAARDFNFITTEKAVELIKNSIDTIKSLRKWNGHLYNWYDTIKLTPLKPKYVSTVDSGNLACCLITLAEGLKEYEAESNTIPAIISDIHNIINEMDFRPLYNNKKKLLMIGVEIDEKQDDENYYDLFMSESRMISYYLIAKGEIPKKHWFTLSRLLIEHNGYFGMKSWTGTMFEYLMPHIFLPLYEGSLAYEAAHFAIRSHKNRVKGKKIPWGISESGFYAFDIALNYQYKAFGTQKLGLKRGLDTELVVSPYSTFLALPFVFDDAFNNLLQLRKEGMYGRFGFYEAADYTKSRTGGQISIVKSFMAHHIGMSFLSVSNAVHDNIIKKRFMRSPQMNCADELLQEKLPANVVVYKDIAQPEIPETAARRHLPIKLELHSISPISPRGTALSNGAFTSVIMDSGIGYLSLFDKTLTRYRNETIKNPRGVFGIINDGQESFSLTYAPFYDNMNNYRTEINETSAVFYCKNNYLETKMKVTVSGKYSGEAREIRIKNNSSKNKSITLLMYYEPILESHATEYSHPAFSNLFVQSEFDSETESLIFKRRERDEYEKGYWLCSGFSGEYKNIEIETLRENILPRLEGTKGLKHYFDKHFNGVKSSSVDLCCAMKVTIKIPSKGSKTVNFYTCAGFNKAEVKEALDHLKMSGFSAIQKSAALSNDFLAKKGEAGEAEKRMLSEILPLLTYSHRCKTFDIKSTDKAFGYKILWKYGISGDFPIILLNLTEKDDVQKSKVFISTFQLLRLKNIPCDLVFVYKEGGHYDRPVFNALKDVLKQHKAENLLEQKGGIHLVNVQTQTDADFLLSASSFCADLHKGFNVTDNIKQPAFILAPIKSPKSEIEIENSIIYKTGAGGFAENGFIINDKEILSSRPPWSLVLANKVFGTLMSDCSLGYTFARNSRENKITPWENDIVTDNTGEKLLLRVDGEIYDICAGGKTVFKNHCAEYYAQANNITVKLTVFTARLMSAKTVLVQVVNKSDRPKRIELCYYVEPVLGVSSERDSRYINVYLEEDILVMKNSSNSDFSKGFAFLNVSGDSFCTNDRAAFYQGVWDSGISGNLNDGICAVKGTALTLDVGTSDQCVFVLGYAQSREDMFNSLNNLLVYERALKELKSVENTKSNINRVYIDTPDNEMNMLFNNFLYQQVLEARLYSRTGFYQCSGAYGFRDQLQDAMSVTLTNPELLKYQIFRCCAHQFEEGDVMHWWHEILEEGKKQRGVRTKCSDDLLWLPFAVIEYLERTENYSILDKSVYYLKAPELKDDEQEKYLFPERSSIKETVYQHCIRAINRGFKRSVHGLMQFGSGDWNDAMNTVGIKGVGESVWLSMFTVNILERFLPICEKKEDTQNLERFAGLASSLRKSVEEQAWDGKWYLRGFYDDESPLGSEKNDECKIDLLPQCFASICGFDKEKTTQALEEAKKLLVDRKNEIVELLTPAFDKGIHNPGYIKGYIPGIRENGGQYTHAAVWFALGLLRLGDANAAYEILRMINPVNHSNTDEKAEIYKVEPYVLAGDVYSSGELIGRGGWSWYTGSAGWYYRVVLEEVLGIKRAGKKVYFKPSVPDAWNDFKVKMFIDSAEINITAKRDINKEFINDEYKPFLELDGKNHNVDIYF